MKKIRNIISEARGNRTQAEFANVLGKSQGLLSKYESGKVNPPAAIVEKCMKMLNKVEDESVSSDLLAKRIKAELKEPHHAYARKTIAALLDGMQSGDRI